MYTSGNLPRPISSRDKENTTNSMKHNPSSKVNRWSASQDMPHILYNYNIRFHYHVHTNAPQDPILSHVNPISTLIFYIFGIHYSIIVVYTCSHLPSGLLFSGLPTRTLYAFLFSPHMPCTPCISPLFIILILHMQKIHKTPLYATVPSHLLLALS
jgi:hypothetical protein